MISLQETAIRSQLYPFHKPINFHIFTTINSTNQYLKQNHCPKDSIEICLAEEQTAGRGRFGRQWVSPFGENIYFSYSCNVLVDIAELSGLSLAVGLGVLQSLEVSNLIAPILIKWPNDLIWENKKLGGILIESLPEQDGSLKVIIGIGLNINSDPKQQILTDKPYTSLYEISGKKWDRNYLVAQLIRYLEANLGFFLKSGFAWFAKEWQKVDYLYGKPIEIYQSKKILKGFAWGVNSLGELCIEDEQGKKRCVSSGEASISGFE